MPEIYIIGGPNGAGKTTSAKSLLPKLLHCHEYINADEIAASLSPFNPESVSLKACEQMLARIDELASQKKNFAFETTMAADKFFVKRLAEWKANDYKINLIFFWLQNPDLALARVKDRAANGGHNIAADTILRRYKRSINHFLNIYSTLADNWVLYDNTEKFKPVKIAEKKFNTPLSVYNNSYWQKFQESYHE